MWVTSDLHLGHKLAAEMRGYHSVLDHDAAMIRGINFCVNKNDKLFVLGDVAFNMPGLEMLTGLRVQNMDLVLGNHDKLDTQVYLKYFRRCWGVVKYRNFWLSHAPIVEQEICARVRGNVHGHIHLGGMTPSLPLPHYNVGVEFHEHQPVRFTDIEATFDVAEGKRRAG